jgi:hypothetical protein
MTFTYRKIGRRTAEESRLENELHDFFDANPDKAPSDVVTTAQELKSLHEKFVFDNIEVVETEIKGVRETPNRSNISDDPLNRQSPKVRAYVLDNNTADSTQTDFAEPVSFDDTFAIPDPNDDSTAPDSASKAIPETKKPKTEKREKEGPIFNDDENDSTAKIKKKTKNFANAIVKITCDLFEFGVVWYSTKDITDEKLEELQAETGVDLTLLLEMEDNQRITVRDFLIQTRILITENVKIDEPDRKELADALFEVLLEQGIQPTHGQHVLLVCAKIALPKGLFAFTQVKLIGAVISQIKAAAAQNMNHNYNDSSSNSDNSEEEYYDTEDVEFPPVEETPKTD